MKIKVDKQNGKKNIIKIAIIAVVVALVGYCAFYLVSNAADISKLRTQKEDLNTKYEQQMDDNKKVKSILNSDNKDDYIEQKAREKGYVKDGEVVYYDISSSK